MRPRFSKDSRGSFAVMTALALPAFVGFAGIALEIGTWYADRRAMQGAADAAAFSAAVAYTVGTSPKTDAQTEALGVAALNGFTDQVNGVSVTANIPPKQGKYTDTSTYTAVEVIIKKPVNPTLSRLVGFLTGPTIPARAVAALDVTNSDCMVGLNKTAAGTVTLKGGVTVSMSCGIGDNSNSTSAFSTSGSSATVNAGSISVVGGDSLSGSPTLNPTPQTGAAPIANPYSSLSVPNFSDPHGCKGLKINGGGTTTLDPNTPSNSTSPYDKQVVSITWPPGGVNSGSAKAMVICGDISINGGGTLQLNPGVYIIDGGSLTVPSGTIMGSGVTIILTTSSTNMNNIGTVNISGGSLVQLTADTAGPFPGFVFFQDPRASSAKTPPNASIAGTSSSYINGALYFPGVQVSFSGNSKGGGGSSTGCTQLIADSITLNGNVDITNSGCSGLGLKTIGQTRLVE